MKITKSYLKQIIKEELQRFNEGDVVNFPTSAKEKSADKPEGEPADVIRPGFGKGPDLSKITKGPFATHKGSPPPKYLGSVTNDMSGIKHYIYKVAFDIPMSQGYKPASDYKYLAAFREDAYKGAVDKGYTLEGDFVPMQGDYSSSLSSFMEKLKGYKGYGTGKGWSAKLVKKYRADPESGI